MLLTQYQPSEYRKLRKPLEIIKNIPMRKPTKRKVSTAITEPHNTTRRKQ